MGNDDIIAFRTREQPRKYLGILLVMAVAYFAAGWLGKKVKLDALAKHVAKVSRKMFEVPEFFYYAIADGLRWPSRQMERFELRQGAKRRLANGI